MKVKDINNGRYVKDHGLAKHPLYKTYITMHSRCYKPSNPKYYNYGAKGIIVCERWHTVTNFIADMGERPKNTTLDRIDNNGNYEPANCRWATSVQQMNNRGMLKNNTTGVNGVSYNKRMKKYIARRDYNKQTNYLGAYKTLLKATKAIEDFNKSKGL